MFGPLDVGDFILLHGLLLANPWVGTERCSSYCQQMMTQIHLKAVRKYWMFSSAAELPKKCISTQSPHRPRPWAPKSSQIAVHRVISGIEKNSDT